MNRTEPLAAVTFDLDGTLYDARAFRRAYFWRAGFGIFRARKIRRLKERFRGEVFADGDALRATLEQELGVLFQTDAEHARKIEQKLFETLVLEAVKKVGPRPGAHEAVQCVLDAGLKIGVVSDYSPHAKLSALGLDDLPWSTLMGAEQVGALKPYPRVFEHAASELGVSPSAVLHIGDRADTDVKGAEAAGCRAVLVEPGAMLLDCVRAALAEQSR